MNPRGPHVTLWETDSDVEMLDSGRLGLPGVDLRQLRLDRQQHKYGTRLDEARTRSQTGTVLA
jgi:hypothetical protein